MKQLNNLYKEYSFINKYKLFSSVRKEGITLNKGKLLQ